MLAFATRRYLAEYRAATDNEIATDLLFLEHAERRPETVGYIPRVPIWLGRFSNNPVLTRLASRLVGFFWLILAGLPFHLFKTVHLFKHRLRTAPTQSQALQDVTEVGLALSRRATEVVRRPEIPAPDVWIIPPWVGVDHGKRRDVSLLCLVSARDIALAFQLALLATWTMSRDKQRRRWILQTYTAVPWFLARIALMRVDADFFIAEHFDRWAVMADMVTRAWRRKGRRERRLTLIQHGYVGNMKGQKVSFLPPHKLTAVTALYVYDDASDSMFRSQILAPRAAQTAIGHRFTPRITLTPLCTGEIFRILFVGHPLCADLQLAVLEQLRDIPTAVFYKPHPLAGLPTICKDKRWTVIEERTLFPVVDLVVSYRSTLVTEYEQHGITSIVHELTSKTDECFQIATKIRGSFPR